MDLGHREDKPNEGVSSRSTKYEAYQVNKISLDEYDKLNNKSDIRKTGQFRKSSMSTIQNLVRLHYVFYPRSDISADIIDLLYKNEYLRDNIENVSNQNHD